MVRASQRSRKGAVELFRRTGYTRYFATVASARATGTMFNVGVVLLVFQRTGSLSLAGLTAAAGSFPAGLTGPFLGAWLDITRSRRALIALDQGSSALALAGILLLAGHSPRSSVVLIAIAFGITRPLSGGAFSSVLPEIAGDELLAIANTMEATSVNLAYILGPALAGIIAGAAGPAAAVEVEIGMTVLVIVLISGNATFDLRSARLQNDIRGSVSQGLRALWSIAPLRAGALAAIFSVTAWGVLIVGFPAYALRLHAGSHASGYLWAAVSAGSVLSALTLSGLARRLPTLILTAGSLVAMGLSAGLWPLAHNLLGGLALVTLTGLLEGPALGAFLTVRQRYTPAALRGQVFATVSSFNLVGMAVGSAVAGPIQSSLGTTATLVTFGLLEIAAALAMLGARGSLTGVTSHA
jgi:MFS family permease